MTEPAVAAPAGAATRALAARVVARVAGAGMTLETALATAGPGDPLTSRDRAQVRALASGALRGWFRYRRLAEEWARGALDPEVLALLAVGWFQLEDADQPAYAVVSATVDGARELGAPRAASLINALLRRYQRDGADFRARHAADPEVAYAHPAWLAQAMTRDWPDAAGTVLAANQVRPPLWLRVNRRRVAPAEWAARCAAATGQVPVGVDGFPAALRLPQPLPVEALPGFADGDVSVQDAAAQLAAPMLAAEAGMRVLDACAAPGGKSAHLLELADDRLELLALDNDAARLPRLSATLARLGLAGARVQQADALAPDDWWDGKPFHRILVDAPCSGTGVIRRHPDIKLLRRHSDVAAFAVRQGQLLDRLWPLLAPGGRLLYATCSVLAAENAAVVTAFLERAPSAHALPVAVPDGLGRSAGPGVQILPGPGATDGFYYALMTRTRAP